MAGIDFQQKQNLGIICDLTGKIRFQVEFAGGPRPSPEAAKIEIRHAIDQLRLEAGKDWKKVQGICFADPGLVDINTGFSLRAVNVPAWENVSTKSWLEHICGMPALVLPDTMALTYMEYRNRLPEPPTGLFLLSTGAGIGGGFIKQGELFCRRQRSRHGNRAPGDGAARAAVPFAAIAAAWRRFVAKPAFARKVEEALQNGVETKLRNADFSLEHFIQCAGRKSAPPALLPEKSASIWHAA